jgi:predicted AlkP superfamily phosphohydrolase/phosphomutase
LLLELDSLSLSLVRDHLELLPTIRELIEDGGELVETASTADIASASVWPTFATGELPGKHGHYYPFQWHAEKMQFYRPYRRAWQGQLDYEPFWYELARDGFASQALDAVQCVPQANSPCLEICDWSAQSSGNAMTSNRATLKELRRRFGKRPIRREVPVAKSGEQTSSLQEQVIASMKQKTDAIMWLGRRHNWRFYLASIQDVHRAGHNLWHTEGEFASEVEADALLQVYRAMDAEIARILEAFGGKNTHIVLLTLNGMASNHAQNHFLPQILDRLNRLYLTDSTAKGVSDNRRGLMARLRDKVPAGIQYSAANLLGDTVQDWVVNREFTGALEWSSTPSFTVVTGGEGLVRLNLKGREKCGMLSDRDGTAGVYLDWLKERLLEIRVNRTSEPLISEVVDVHGLYPGQKSHLLPDIALKWAPREPATEVSSPTMGTVRQKLLTGRGGNHTGESFAILPARTVDAGVANGLRHITDYRGLVGELLT